MTAPARLHRFTPDGRYQGFIVVDRPIAQYAQRMGVDLCEEAPPPVTHGNWPFRVEGTWVVQPDPAVSAPATPPPEQQP